MVKNSAAAPTAHHVHILSSPCVSVVYWTYLCYGSGMKSERLVVQMEPKLKEAHFSKSIVVGQLAPVHAERLVWPGIVNHGLLYPVAVAVVLIAVEKLGIPAGETGR